MLTSLAAIAPLCVIGVVLTAASWWEGLIITTGLILILGVLREWSVDGYLRRAVVALMFTGANWLWSNDRASSRSAICQAPG